MTDIPQPGQYPPKKQGGGFLKWCLVCGCLALLAGGAAMAVFTLVIAKTAAALMPDTDPIAVQSRLQKILPAQVPAGYEGVMAWGLPGVFEFAMFAPQGTMSAAKQGQKQDEIPLMLIVCTVPPGENADKMKQQMSEMLEKQGNNGPQTLEVENAEGSVKQEIKVRGEGVSVEQTVGTSKEGQKIKQVMALVPKTKGSNEMVLIMGVGTADKFDDAALNAFFQSIR